MYANYSGLEEDNSIFEKKEESPAESESGWEEEWSHKPNTRKVTEV